MAFAIAPEGSTLSYTDKYMRAIGKIVNSNT